MINIFYTFSDDGALAFSFPSISTLSIWECDILPAIAFRLGQESTKWRYVLMDGENKRAIGESLRQIAREACFGTISQINIEEKKW